MSGGPQSFDDTNSAMGQGPTQDPSHFPTLARPAGTPVGGTENMRAQEKAYDPRHGRPAHPGPSRAPFGVPTFTDGKV